MKVILGDVHEVCDEMEAESFDSCFCDPPYGLKFMGKDWDHGVPSVEMWRSIHRVLKPGAMLLAFGGPRTHHRLMVAIEDAGFEIRDTLMWIYGSGFPKSHDISKSIDKTSGIDREDKFGAAIGRNIGPTGNKKCDICGKWLVSGSPCKCPRPQDSPVSEDAKIWEGYGTALKPAWEPIILAMKPLDGTFVNNALEHGVGGLNIDGGRLAPMAKNDPSRRGLGQGYTKSHRQTFSPPRQAPYNDQKGRWPANIILDEESGKQLDEQAGPRNSTRAGGNPNDIVQQVNDEFFGMSPGRIGYDYRDTGGASRFFYCAKASRSEREAGCAGGKRDGSAHNTSGRRYGGKDRLGGDPYTLPQVRNHHPTVKPLDLCRYLATLIKPPEPGKLLVPFCGSGSEMIGARQAGWVDVVGIEKEKEYVDIAEARIEYHSKPFKQKEKQDEFWEWE